MSRNTGKKKKQRARKPPQAAPGTAPGTLTPLAFSAQPRVQLHAFGAEECHRIASPTIPQIQEALSKYPVVWVNVDGLGDARTIQELGELFKIHRLALEDVLSPGQLSKFEAFDAIHTYYVVIRHAKWGEDVIATEQVNLFFGQNFVLTFNEQESTYFDPVRRRLERPAAFMRGSGSVFLAYSLIDCVIDHYFPILERLADEMDRLEIEVFDPSPGFMESVRATRQRALKMFRRVAPMKEVLAKILYDSSNLIGPEVKPYFKDCQDHVLAVLDQLDTFRQTTADLMSLHHSHLSASTNETMKVLTIISTIFIPLSFIAGVYGMNFRNMPELRSPYGYPAVMLLMLAVGLSLVGYFVRKRWIRLPWGLERLTQRARFWRRETDRLPGTGQHRVG